MISLDCDKVRDLLPGLEAGRLPQEEADPVRAHLMSCPECRGELIRNSGCRYCPHCGWGSCDVVRGFLSR